VFSVLPGLGADDYPGLPADFCVDKLPDLTMHRSLSSAVLRNDPSLHERLKCQHTKGGTSFNRCIKPGMDHPYARIGAVAGDEDSYKTFDEYFRQVVQLCHCGYPASSKHPTNLSHVKVSSGPIDPVGKHACSVRLLASRNLKGFRFGPSCSLDDRRNVERLLISAMKHAVGADGQVEYFPLSCSSSCPAKPSGMSELEEEKLLSAGLLFREPHSVEHLAAGLGRHWPDARGIAVLPRSQNEAAPVSGAPVISAWVNEEDHLLLMVSQEGQDVKSAFARLSDSLAGIKRGLEAEGSGFARTDHYGYLTVCPSKLGTALHASVQLKLPCLSSPSSAGNGLHEMCYGLGLMASHVSSSSCKGLWDIANLDTLGCSEVDLVNRLISGCSHLVELEKMMEDNFKNRSSQSFDIVSGPATSVFSMLPGLGSEDYPGFSTKAAPQFLQDLSNHHSIAIKLLKEDPSIYGCLRDRRTMLNVSLAQCIKPGMDSPSSTLAGIVACDEHSYERFKEVFVPVVKRLHGKQNIAEVYPTNVSIASVAESQFMCDYIVASEITCRRNLSGFRFPTACTRGERQEVERRLCTALLMMPKGEYEYRPLSQSSTYNLRPDGMSTREAQDLETSGLLFREPQSIPALASGVGRHWPESRGVLVSASRELAAWINEEDHLVMMSIRQNGDLRSAFEKLVTSLQCVENRLQQESHGFARHDQWGFLTTSPWNVGTGVSVRVTLRLPQLSNHPVFSETCQRSGMKLQHCQHGSGLWEVSLGQVFGQSEVDLINIMITNCERLVGMEKILADGGQLVDTHPADQVASATHTSTVFALLPGLGETATAGFPMTACPALMPDLRQNQTLLADVLRRNMSVYDMLRHKKTSRGVTFAQCIKPGIDNGASNAIGLFAGDEECYTVFKCLFDRVIAAQHPLHQPGLNYRAASAPQLLQMSVDSSGTYAKTVSVSCSRNISGFRFPPACDRQERREIEDLLNAAFATIRQTELAGDYFPLPLSSSVESKPTGMTAAEEAELTAHGLLFNEPRSDVDLSAGIGRHWPDARGVFLAKSRQFGAWFNEQDHLHMTSFQADADLQKAYMRLSIASSTLERTLEDKSRRFAFCDHLGYLSSCTSNLGTCLRAVVTMKLPLLTAQPNFLALCRSLGLVAHVGTPSEGVATWEVEHSITLGRTEEHVINSLVVGCMQLVLMERALEGLDEATNNVGNALRSSLSGSSDGKPARLTVACVEALLKQSCSHLTDSERSELIASVDVDTDGSASVETFTKCLIGKVRSSVA